MELGMRYEGGYETMKSTARNLHHGSKPCIYNHDILSCTHDDVTGNHLYSGRALGLTKPEDIIQINPFLKNLWNDITAHYSRVELDHTQHVLWDISLERMKLYPKMDDSFFFFGARENNSRPARSWFKVVEHINDKNNFIALGSHLGLDTPKTLCFSRKRWLAGIENFSFPCYVKPALSVAGKGIYRCRNVTEVIQALAYFAEDVPLQIQEEVHAESFLNLQYEQTVTELKRREVTEQILDRFTHVGNQYPSKYTPWESVDPMADWLVKKGMRGIFAFDVAVINDKHGPRFIPIECNPRFNGASYPSAIARKLGIDQWVSREMSTRHRKLSEIDLSSIEYDPSRKTGVILVNWGTILVGKISVLIAGPEYLRAQIGEKLAERL